MSYYFTTQFLTLLEAGWTPANNVQLYVFPQAPRLGIGVGSEQEGDSVNQAYASINIVTNLVQQLGWGSDYVVGPAIAMTKIDVEGGKRHLIETANFIMGTIPTTKMSAIAFALDKGGPTVDEIMFVTDTTVSQTTMPLHTGDGFVPALNPDYDERVLFYWEDVPAGAAAEAVPLAVEGQLLMERTPPAFQPAGTQYVWIYPQRVNLIANPSFEQNSTFWRSNGTLSLVSEAPPGAGTKCGRLTGAKPLILESSIFPLTYGRRRESGMTMQMQVRGSGTLKVGLVSWEPDFLVTRVDWGHEPVIEGETSPSWTLTGGGFQHIRTLRDTGESTSGMLRLEFMPSDASLATGTFDIDQVCVEPGKLPSNFNDWLYFDGSTKYGAKDDFQWYGGEARAHTTYSCWYNLRQSTFGRLFAYQVDASPETLTDVEASKMGLAYQWVPAGTPIQSRTNVLFPGDPVSPLVAWTGPILPYRTDIAPSLQNITSPW